MKLLIRSRHVHISATGRPGNSENEKMNFEKSLEKGVDKPQAMCDTTGAVDERTKTVQTLQAFETPDTQAQAHDGLPGCWSEQDNQQKPEVP